VYGAAVISYLALGTVLWLQLIGSAPLSPPLTALRRVMVLTGTVVAGSVVGMVLVFGSAVVYTGSLRHQPAAAVLADLPFPSRAAPPEPDWKRDPKFADAVPRRARPA